jgi:RNA polymerase sigma-70 factor (ECF subfamily)
MHPIGRDDSLAKSPPSPIAWHALLAQHDRWLRMVVLARVGQAASVDEVMQEVALAAVRQQAPLRDPSKAAPWLYRLAIRQSLLFRRKQGRWRKLTAQYAERVRPSERDHRVPDPLQWLLADEQQSMVREAIGRMSRRDVEILLLKYSENWSYEQLAQRLGSSESAVESRLHRARQRLRRELAALNGVRVEP